MGVITFKPYHTRGVQPNWDVYLAEMRRFLKDVVGPSLVKYFEEVVAEWEIKPEFVIEVSSQGYGIRVHPRGERADVWGYLSGGTIYIDPRHFEADILAKYLPKLPGQLKQANRRALRMAIQQARPI